MTPTTTPGRPGSPASAAGRSRSAAQTAAPAFAEHAAAGGALLIPVGATEQHGPHMPLGTDAMLATAVATGVAERIGALVMPAFTYGYRSQQRSGGGDHLAGTTSLGASTLAAVTRDVVGDLLDQGARRIVLVNGHYENYQFLYDGVDLALRERRTSREQAAVLLLSYWDYVSEETIGTVYPEGFPGWDIEHGGVLETSLMLRLHPELVDMDRAPAHPPAELRRFDRLPVIAERTPESGCLSAPGGSSAEHGELLYTQVVADIAADLSAELPRD